MPSNNLKKYLASVLLLIELAVLPMPALAQLGNLNPVPINDAGSTAQNAIFSAAIAPVKATYNSCLTAVNSGDAADNTSQLGFSGMSLIGGDAVLMTKLAAKMTLYQIFITCANGVLLSLEAVPAPNSYTWTQKQTFSNQVTAAIQAYKTKYESVQARFNNAKQGFWKTLVFNILIKTSKAMAKSLVNKLVSNYKVRNVMQYTDSVATLMYDNQFIRQNFPEAQGQLMARAILENPQVRSKVPASVFIAADGALGFNPKLVDVNDPLFYTKMANVGSAISNPYFIHNANVGGVDQARAQSLAYAQSLVSQSNGLKTPVTCAGSLAQQRSLDAQWSSVERRLEDRQKLLNNLQQAKILGMAVSDSDLQKAQSDYDSALLAEQSLPTMIGTSSAASIICESIVSPASMIDKGINEAFKAIGVDMQQYNDNNLPSFMKLIADAASQIGSSLIFGGLSGAKSAALINEQRVVSGAVQAGTEALYSNASENLAKGIIFTADKSESYADGYTLNWEIITATISGASFVTIQGDGISTVTVNQAGQQVPNKLTLSGSTLIHTTKAGPYILTVYDSNGRALTAATMNVALQSQPLAQNTNYQAATAVLGAYTEKPALQVRGSAAIQPRGPTQ